MNYCINYRIIGERYNNAAAWNSPPCSNKVKFQLQTICAVEAMSYCIFNDESFQGYKSKYGIKMQKLNCIF